METGEQQTSTSEMGPWPFGLFFYFDHFVDGFSLSLKISLQVLNTNALALGFANIFIRSVAFHRVHTFHRIKGFRFDAVQFIAISSL